MLTMNTSAGNDRFFEAISELSSVAEESARRELMVDQGVIFHETVLLD
jgi:hypothetical protein